jgi:hypothetical protein
MVSVSALLGVEGVKDFKQSLNKKHLEQLKKINLEPTENWKFFMEFGDNILPRIQSFTESNQEVEMTSIRKVFMTQWSNPSDPTMAGQFNVNVSCLDFFNKKFPAETLTCLMMQAVSLGLAENDSFRNYISFRKIFRSKEAYIGLVVKLPECGDHIATIVFENCHTISIRELSTKIRAVMKMMTYCYKKREHLEKTNPQVQKIMEQMVSEYAYSTYSYPMAGTPFVSLSNIGFCGYSQSMSPLRCNETMKFTLMEVERRPVWDKETQSFKPEDILPVSISADHRLFDGNLPVPKMTSQYFEAMFAKMIGDKSNLSQSKTDYAASELLIENLLNKLISSNIEMGYKTLLFLQTYWFDFLSIEDLLQTQELERSLYPV